MKPNLTEIIGELEQAYAEHGDVELDGDLLELAVIAFALSREEGQR